jgi:hypothetical protein
MMRESFRRYQHQQLGINTDLLATLLAVQEDAKRAGLDKLTKREINAEIAGHRREQGKKKIKQPVR